MWREGKFVHCWWECKLVYSLLKTVWRFLKKLKIELLTLLTWVVQTHGGVCVLQSNGGHHQVCKSYRKNLRTIITLVDNFASIIIICTYCVFVVVEIIIKVETMANLRTSTKKNSSNFTLMVAIWVGRSNITRYFTFSIKAGN